MKGIFLFLHHRIMIYMKHLKGLHDNTKWQSKKIKHNNNSNNSYNSNISKNNKRMKKKTDNNKRENQSCLSVRHSSPFIPRTG